ncbi:hypothetical protein [Streptomyces sp. NBC_00151]|uniref:hypothetical protein n=1 Tax=Streptomyces sp. NBC_00151 TaxID=2975669 RepID=UPI002DDA01C8|nr:hypothetical protein [Streptomyces sp. NBC_00151]WRZ44535.1 hypothetical protein OG915_44940 [Streptomyces sp. NBC_00151]
MTASSRTGQPQPARPARARLTAHLIKLKRLSGDSFTDLAARTTVSASTLKRAVGTGPVPQEHVVTAFVHACAAGDEQPVLMMWRAARAEERGILEGLQAPQVDNIRTRAELKAAFAAVYERAGAPPVRTVRDRAGVPGTAGACLLPPNTAWRITRREAQLADWPQCEAFLRGCGEPAHRIARWREAWKRSAEPVVAASRRQNLSAMAHSVSTVAGMVESLNTPALADCLSMVAGVFRAVEVDKSRLARAMNEAVIDGIGIAAVRSSGGGEQAGTVSRTPNVRDHRAPGASAGPPGPPVPAKRAARPVTAAATSRPVISSHAPGRPPARQGKPSGSAS